jgi:hypothetical protein
MLLKRFAYIQDRLQHSVGQQAARGIALPVGGGLARLACLRAVVLGGHGRRAADCPLQGQDILQAHSLLCSTLLLLLLLGSRQGVAGVWRQPCATL